MSAKPWTLPTAPADTPRLCHVCGEEILFPRYCIVAQPHSYHRNCYTAFHAAMNDKAHLTKTIAEIRALVGEDVKKARKT